MVLRIELGARGYDIILERGCLRRAEDYLNLNRRVLIVTDEGVPEQWPDRIEARCANPLTVRVPSGEASKSLAGLERLYRYMLEAGFTRSDCIVAVGGGVVGDLAGFAASTWMRGIDFYNVPTTMLSQVDSSIGGKTAVNLDGIKNVVGTFYQPKCVLVDPDTLQTLPERQIAAGLAESVKMALTHDAELFQWMEVTDPMSDPEKVIGRSLEIKKRVVEEDERESGERRKLNFGHTIGHALESAGREPGLLHGECVAMGMLPMCAEPVRVRLERLLKRLGLPTGCGLDPRTVYEAMLHDKKKEGERIRVVLVDAIGCGRIELTEPEALKDRIAMVAKGGVNG